MSPRCKCEWSRADPFLMGQRSSERPVSTVGSYIATRLKMPTERGPAGFLLMKPSPAPFGNAAQNKADRLAVSLLILFDKSSRPGIRSRAFLHADGWDLNPFSPSNSPSFRARARPTWAVVKPCIGRGT